jgi:YD repeat-containing protein
MSSTTPSGKSWAYNHDAFGNVTKTTDPLNHFALRSYDKNQNPILSVDPNNNSTTYVYDLANEPIQVKRADGTVTATDYNLDGTIRVQKDGKNHRGCLSQCDLLRARRGGQPNGPSRPRR